jgi:heme exporter protein A
MENADPPPAIELSDLVSRYGREVVLRDINLIIRPGRTVVLTGENGAGKTTLLKVLATRLRPNRGSGKVFGFDLLRQAPEVRRRLAFLSVQGGSYLELTACENLRLAARLYNKDRTDIERVLNRVGLWPKRHKLVRTYSSGMKKRLGLARLLLSEAELWLLDEPYASLDEEGRDLIDTLLGEAKVAGKTVAMASHEVSRCTAVADSILVIKSGRLRTSQRLREDARA